MMKNYRAPTKYRSASVYRRGWMPAKPYRAGTPYRKPDFYGGGSSILPVESVGFGGGGVLPWKQAEVRSALHGQHWDAAADGSATIAMRYGEIDEHSQAMTTLPIDQRTGANETAAIPFRDFAQRLFAMVGMPWVAYEAHNRFTGLPFGDLMQRLADQRGMPWRTATSHDNADALPWRQYAAHALSHSALWQAVTARGGFVAMPWSPIAARSSRTVIDWVVDPDDGTDPITVPILPVYVMIPTLSVVRLPERTPIPVLSVSLQGELGSWAWSFTAPMARAGLALIDDGTGTPTEIEVSINGHVWTFIVDGYDDNRRFNSNTCTLRGRSRSALLAEPHAAVRSYIEDDARNASQLADQELAGSGWTLLWDAPDWLVPGGTFSYTDLAPLDAIAAVANSIGAALLSHPEDKELQVVPSYPDSPWGWDAATPYAIVPASILTEGSSSWVGGVNANGVYVYAQNNASGALVKITGSDGAAQLPMVVDPLAVHADAQRERGRAELAANGIKRRIQRTVPLFPPPVGEEDIALGAVPLGALVEFQEPGETWRGQVMGVRIDAQRSGRAMSVRQHLTIERQYR